MADFTLEELAAATKGRLLRGEPGKTVHGLTIDSRRIEPGQLFLALKGERFDGHDFISAALAGGARAVVLDDEGRFDEEQFRVYPDPGVILVPDSQEALGAIARFHRDRFQIPVIAVTGSNGKTTTKDLVAAILAQEWPIIKTEANFNNEIGLPLTLLKIDQTTRAAVVEMGMRGLGQIRHLCGIARPEMGIVTNVGLSHLELLGSQENIARAKAELIEALPGTGLAVLNGDDPYVRAMTRKRQSDGGLRTVRYGIDGPELDYRADKYRVIENGSSFRLVYPKGSFEVTLPIPGRHNVLNALAAIALAKELGFSDTAIRKGLANPGLTEKRLNRIECRGFTIIDDTYNASPASVRAAIDVLCSLPNRNRRFAVLSDMLELGTTAASSHREIGTYAAERGIDHLFAWGDLALEYTSGMNDVNPGKAAFFTSKSALVAELKSCLKPGDAVLVKGSRSMKMEEVVKALSGEGTEG
ncbi:MAG TPA: UDP-N-acetylmuramoyl-tripeptide--D-alanyl-D-alanine ligase [Bacillota bacterium]